MPQLMLSAFGTSAHVPGVVSKRSGELPLNIVLKFTSSHCCAEQTEGLHGGARLEVRLRGVVELVLEVVAAAVDRLHRAGLLVERDAAHLNALRHRLPAGHLPPSA